MNAPLIAAQSRDGALTTGGVKCSYAQVYNFPRKVQNLRAKIEAMRDEARALGFTAEASQLAAMAVFAQHWIEPAGPQRVRGWCAEHDATLARLWAEGMTGAEIAERLPKSRAAVLARARALGLPERRCGRRAAA